MSLIPLILQKKKLLGSKLNYLLLYGLWTDSEDGEQAILVTDSEDGEKMYLTINSEDR